MLKSTYKKILFLSVLFCFSFIKVSSQTNNQSIQTAVHLLNYVSMDYAGSVENGKVTNPQEYQEQIEFSKQALDLVKENPSLITKDPSIVSDIETLKKIVAEKKPAAEIQKVANEVKGKIIQIAGLPTAPKTWPNLNNGQALYQANCATCHGNTGMADGPGAKGLDPSPTKFIDEFIMKGVSPFHAYNSIKLGVPGTAMRSFSEFTDQQMWDLAFYVKSLAHQKETKDAKALKAAFNEIYPKVNLRQVATLSDVDLHKDLIGKTDNPDKALAALRLLTPSKKQENNSLEIAKSLLASSVELYDKGDNAGARTKALNAYLEGIEPVEARLRTINPTFVIELEQQMMKVRQSIEKKESTEQVSQNVDKALSLIADADQIMHGQKLNYWLTFLLAASIMLREGLEAFLVLAVVLALIRSSGIRKALPWLHGGWITAVLLGVAGWFLSDYIIKFGGKNREVMEGLVSLLAVVVLLSVGFWLHNNSYAKQWKDFIENRIGKLLKRENMIGLAAFSFMVVFREVFEIILFLQAINLEAEPQNKSAIGVGVLFAIVIILIIAYLFVRYSKFIPVRKLFLYSSWIVVFLAIILVGKGVHSLQESGWISVSGFSSNNFRVDWLGIFPTWETMFSQVGLFVFILAMYFFYDQKRKKA